MTSNSHMFSNVDTWNPIGGECPHKCVYCWRTTLCNRYPSLCKKYSGPAQLFPKVYEKRFKHGETIFPCSMIDLMANAVPDKLIRAVFFQIAKFPHTTFMPLTKNPARYFNFKIPDNCIIGATVESNKYYPTISLAPPQKKRLQAMIIHSYPRKFICIEPILDFTERFISYLRRIKPNFVYVGYDNYNHHLPEPSLEKTQKLISELEQFTEVRRKTLRKGWNENA